jgi:hypothetical protein
MAKWWYYSIVRCPECKASYEIYDPSGPWYDSGLSSSPVSSELCPECFAEKQRPDLEEEAREMLESAVKHLADEYEYFPFNLAQAQAADILMQAQERIGAQ